MKTILIIEDNRDIREGTAEILRMAEYQVLEAENGLTGTHIATEQKPDLILCDIMMPEMDGFGVLYTLNKNPETTGIPFIFLTAKADKMDHRRGMEMGADDYLTKPYDEAELLNAIESRLARERRRQDRYQNAVQRLDVLTKTPGKGAAALKELTLGRKVRQLRKKQVLYYEGDQPQGLYMVLNGAIRSYKLAGDGRELVMHLYVPEHYLGVHAALADQPYTETAEAVEDSTVCLLPKDAVTDLIGRYPELAKQFIGLLAEDIREKEEFLMDLAYHSVRKRLAQTLVRLYKSQFSGQGELHVSRDDLAAMAGIAVETVSRTLSDFRDEALIEKHGTLIRIIDLAKLQKMKN